MASDSPAVRVFVSAAVRWCRGGDETALQTLLRSPYSGVAHDVGAAYATLAARNGPLLDAIDRGRLAIPPADRDAVIEFAQRLRKLRALAEHLEDEPLSAAIREAFPAPLPSAARFRRSARDDRKAIDLTEAVEPEKPAGVQARQRHFSASALNAYAECSRKWFYRYACGAIEDEGSSASAYGTAFHLALEDFHGEFPRPQPRDEKAMRERVVEYVTWAFERNRDGFKTNVEFELQRRRAQRTAQRYVDWLLAEHKRAPFEVIGREVPVNLDLDGHEFVGFIDRLDRDERSGGIGVVDYKTGSIAVTAAEYRDKVRKFRDFQLPFYYWARTAAGDRVSTLALIPLKDALLDVKPIVLEVVPLPISENDRSTSAYGRISVTDLERARTRMIELSGQLASGSVDKFAVATDPGACSYCAYATACAHKPPRAEERFGR